MNTNEETVTFTDEQKRVFQRELAAQSGKPVVYLSGSLLTSEQKAEQAQAAGDFLAVKNDQAVRNAYLAKYGVDGFAALQRRHLDSERQRKAAEERELHLADQKRRRGRV